MMQNASNFDLWLTLSVICFAAPMMMFVYSFIMEPCETMQENDKELVETLMNLQRSTLDPSQAFVLLTQIETHPMKFALFNCIMLNKLTITFLIAEISSWFFVLLQYDLDSSTSSDKTYRNETETFN